MLSLTWYHPGEHGSPCLSRLPGPFHEGLRAACRQRQGSGGWAFCNQLTGLVLGGGTHMHQAEQRQPQAVFHFFTQIGRSGPVTGSGSPWPYQSPSKRPQKQPPGAGFRPHHPLTNKLHQWHPKGRPWQAPGPHWAHFTSCGQHPHSSSDAVVRVSPHSQPPRGSTPPRDEVKGRHRSPGSTEPEAHMTHTRDIPRAPSSGGQGACTHR